MSLTVVLHIDMVNNCVQVTKPSTCHVLRVYTSGTDISEGREFDCIVLHIDVVNKSVEVTPNPQVVMYYMYTSQV